MHGWYEDLIEFRDAVEMRVFDTIDIARGETVVLTDSIKRQWNDKIAELRASATKLDQASIDLYATRELAFSISASEGARWESARADVDNLQALYRNALGLVDAAASGLRAVGLGAIQFALPLSLGAIVALIAASGATIATVYSAIEAWKAFKFDQNVRAGMAPVEARASVEGQYPTAGGQAWSTAIPQTVAYVAFGLAAIFLLPKLIGKR